MAFLGALASMRALAHAILAGLLARRGAPGEARARSSALDDEFLIWAECVAGGVLVRPGGPNPHNRINRPRDDASVTARRTLATVSGWIR